MDFLKGLNPEQQRAVSHVDGPLLILAGAGSGKTRVITHRICHMIVNHHVPANSVLAVTFTNKAADEMRQRVAGQLGSAYHGPPPEISTFHSFCVRLLRRDGTRLADVRPGFTRRFTIYDDDDQVALIKSIYRQYGIDEKFMQYRAALSAISHAKSHKQTPQDLYDLATDPKASKLAMVFEKYEAGLRQANALDFDDLLLESVRLLRHDADMRQLYNRRIQYLMIDEYQDTNRSQYELMRLLSEERHNVCVVGDEDQSIYGWRGADIRNILDFERDYPDAVVIRLEQNYRSTKNILESASAVVSNNTARKGKWLWTEAGEGDTIGLYEAPDGENEALFIADSIERILSRDPSTRVAVLYRTNFQSRQIEEALRRYGRKYLVVGGFSFYQRAEIKDVLAYLKLLVSPHDSIALLRVINTPARGIGRSTIDQVERYALENSLSLWNAIQRMLDEKLFPARAEAALDAFRRLMTEMAENVEQRRLDETLRMILDRTGYRKMLETDNSPDADTRLGNLGELVSAGAEGAERGESIADFLDHAALVADADAVDENAQISLLTMHNAKGLEFPYVFIAGLEEGLFPHSRSLNSADMLEEERRLCYVGMTRAERRLTLSWARARRRFGGGQLEPSIRSRFISEIPPALLKNLGRERERDVPQVNLFSQQHEVRDSARKNMYTGKTYNSLENIAQFFADRGVPIPRGLENKSGTAQPAGRGPVGQAPKSPPVPPSYPPRASQTAQRPNATRPSQGGGKMATGSTIQHPKYGRGTILRREGEGEEAKLTVSFPGYGLKKLVAKYAGLTIDE
jgi:DNA helicase-2/ATP-dependent DNA helicase PcrA